MDRELSIQQHKLAPLPVFGCDSRAGVQMILVALQRHVKDYTHHGQAQRCYSGCWSAWIQVRG